VLVATDIAARGIDVAEIGHVVNFDLPHVAEDYVHRVGRTARAEASGRASSFAAPDELPLLRGIEKLTRKELRRTEVPRGSVAFLAEVARAATVKPEVERSPRRSGGSGGGRRGSPRRGHSTGSRR